MNKRSKLWAILASGVLTLGVAGVALATDLLDGQVGNKLGGYTQLCDNFGPIGPGEIGVHFILSSPDADSGLLDATFSTDSFSGLQDFDTPANALHWYAVITGDADTTVLSAHTDVNGTNLVVSHVCLGEETSSSSTTSFSSSEESSTTSVSTSESTTSFSSSEESSTTSVVTTPPTDTIFDGGSGNQATGMWLLVAALGVLLGSLVVVAPARAKR
jgi:hypothetical protein